ncbi:hypothetical protein OOK39_31255 [Streptomyces sp. NBC_00264]|uniref:hypothetical protein n=1 Tax=unclassified Streptomyces TaxID=2593676 RepID=UPI0022555B10|nr:MULTISPECIES: hypothetical protein [unclassified Streptomyces]MCX5163711.1 hypothetical protein [Streptomyces sp. NBC_00305]MCX5222234.1 hypothetical protein [Streptomyces sp. NBC_00264]
MAAGHRPTAKSVKWFPVALEEDGLPAVDEAEPLLPVVRMGTVEQAPFDRLDPRAAGSDIGVRQQNFPANAQEGPPQSGVCEHTVTFEAVDHLLPGSPDPVTERLAGLGVG